MHVDFMFIIKYAFIVILYFSYDLYCQRLNVYTTVKHILFNCNLVMKSFGSRFSLIFVILQLIIAQSVHLLVHWSETSNVSQVQGL
jgi:hypothetical protein